MGKISTEQKEKREGKKNQTGIKRIRIAGTVYVTRNLADCMEAAIKLYMEK